MINYPGSLDTIETLFGNLTDVATTTLNNSINSGDLVVTVVDPAKFPLSRQIILIENELIVFTNRVGNVFNVEQRGAYGTTAAAHASGARFRLIYSAAHHNTVVEAVRAQQSESQFYRSPVESDIVTDPSTLTPTDGQQWLIPIGAVGAWSANVNDIARWKDTGWEFIAPLDGMTVYLRNRDGYYSWNTSIWKTAQTQEQRNNTIHNMRTGLIAGGELTISANPAEFNLAEGSGYFIDAYSDPANPTYKYMEWGNLNAQVVPGIANNWTFVSIDTDGNLIQSNIPPVSEALRDTIFLGILYHRDHTSISDISLAPTNGIYAYLEQDLLDIERLYNKVGNLYAPTIGLLMQKSSGTTFGPSINYQNDRQNPNNTTDPYLGSADFYYRSRGVSGFDEYSITNTIDPNNYDLDEVLTPVPADKWTTQRIWWNPMLQKTVITYGQKIYDTQQEALFDIASIGVVDQELVYDSVLRSMLIVKQGATDLTLITQAAFFDANILGSGISGDGEVNSGQNVGVGAQVYQTKLSVFLIFRTLVSDTSAITVTQNIDTINFDFIPGAVDHQTLDNVGINTHSDIDTFIADINTYIDPRVILRETPNVVKVRSTPNPGEFSSIAAAVASIATASSVNPWVVSVAPGVYVEPTIVMKPFVSVIGHGNLATIIVASNPANDLFTASYASAIYNATLTGSTGVGAALIRHNTAAIDYLPFIVNACSFIQADTYIDMNVTANEKVSVILINSTISGMANAFRTAFTVKNSGTGSAILAMNAVVTTGGVSGVTPTDFVAVNGLGAAVIGGNNIFGTLTPSTTNGFRIRDGGSIRMSSVNMSNMNKGVFIENLGAPCSIQADVFIFTDCVEDIRVDQPSATGYVDRPSTRSKLFLDPATAVYVPGIDLQIVNVFKRGGDFTSVKAAVDSITDASPTKTYNVQVGPGIFSEDTITMKPYVTITGSGDVETILEADGPNKHLIIGAMSSSIRSIGIRGASGAGYASVYYAGIAPPPTQSFLVSRCAFGASETLVIADGTTAITVLRVDSCRVIGGFTNGFVVYNTPGIGTQLAVTDTAFQFSIVPTTDVFHVSGVGTQLILGNVLIIGGVTGNCIRTSDGASIRVVACNFSAFAKAIFVENIGAGPTLGCIGLRISDSVIDVQIDHPLASGSITGTMSRSKIIDAPSDVLFTYSDPNSGSFTSTGELFLGPDQNGTVEVSQLFTQASPMGLLEGGVLTDGGGLSVNVTAGVGYTNDGGLIQKIIWVNDSINLPAESASYLYYNSNGILNYSSGIPDTETNILLGRAITTATNIEILDIIPFIARHASNTIDVLLRNGLGVVYDTGSLVVATIARELDIGSGSYYLSGNHFEPTGGLAVPLFTYYRDGVGGFIRSLTTIVNNTDYDDDSGSLVPLTASYYAKHSIYTVGDDINEKYMLVFGQAEYADLTVAEQASLPVPPQYFSEGIVLIASVIVQEGVATIVQIRDERPVLGYKASGISASSDHGNLLGLGDDDHLQYLRTDGARALTGNLDMGGNNIINAPQISGVNIPSHASRHQPNGADPIPTAAGFNVRPDNVASVGTSNSLSRADHLHALPSAAAVTQLPDAANAVGTSNNVARADHIHNIPAAAPVDQAPETGNIKGVAATFALSDHQHNIPTSSPVTDLTATTLNSEGVGAQFARADHTHAITTGTPVTQNPDQLNAIGTADELARADHVHNIPTDAPTTTLSPATTNAEGVGTSFARNDHSHAISTALTANISTILPDDAASAGVLDVFARGDHKHAIAAAAPTTNLTASTANAEGAGTSFSRHDHTHAITTAAPVTQTPDQLNAIGSASELARADHVHNIPADAPIANLTASTANAEGVGTSFARNDHSHALTTGAASTQGPDNANASGSSANLSRADHVHNIPSAIAVSLNATAANAIGVSTSFARADHIHAIITGTPSTLNPDIANAVGVSASLARADHIHNIPTAIAVATGSANAQGVSTSFSRADHVHEAVLARLLATDTVTATTVSTTDVLLTNMAVTPPSGTYLVTFSTSAVNSNNGAERNFYTLYIGGVARAHTVKRMGSQGGAVQDVNLTDIVSVNGSQAVEIHWRVAGNTGSTYQRTMTLVRLGP